MPAQDKFHSVVKSALIQEGWSITHDPYPLSYGGVDLFIDLGAEKLIAAQKGEHIIAVEIKSFLGASPVSDFHLALGQVISYRTALRRKDPLRVLYMAVPLDAYEEFFHLEFTQAAVQDNQLKLIVYDVNKEVIAAWIE